MHRSRPDTLSLKPIGIVKTSFATRVEAPRQPAAADNAEGIIELEPNRNLEHAIEDLAQWERIWVIYWFHRNEGWRPKVLPPRSTTGRKGVLATRSPHRPNPLGLSVLKLERIEGLNLHVRGVDMIDGTPVIDIKPYVAYTDSFPESGQGWLAPAVADPRSAWVVKFSTQAEAQLDWLSTRTPLPLRERIVQVLSLGPQPHPYRRIKPAKDGQMQLAVQEWRAGFVVAGRQIQVTAITTGYRPSQLTRTVPGLPQALETHREFSAAFGTV
jgi:tRNA (adenine37-N6)-methyltransferase